MYYEKGDAFMGNQSYWKVILRYGHIGQRNSVEVARYLAFDEEITLPDVCFFASQMPDVKNTRPISYARKIDHSEYFLGKEGEASNLFLKKLMSFNPIMMKVG